MTNLSSSNKVMRAIFSPAVALLDRLNYTKKFTLLWLVSLAATAVVVYSLFVNLDRVIQPSQKRLEGLALIEPVTRAIQSLQLHRGLSVTLLGGNKSTVLQDQRAAQEKEAIHAFRLLEEKLPPELISTEDYRHIQAEWLRLQREGMKWTVAANLAAHTDLIVHTQIFGEIVADEHLLIMDTDIAQYYLIDIVSNRLTQVLEQLGRLRAYGAGALTRRHISEDQRVELKLIIAKLDDALRHFNLGISSVGRHNLPIHGALRAVARNIDDSAKLVSNLVTADILSGRFTTDPEVFLNIATTQIDQSYAQLYDSLLPMTKRLTQEHIDRAKTELLTSVGISMLIFMLVVYLSVGIYYAIVGNIRALARSARAFAGGDLSVRVNLKTRDELSWVGSSFNEMADGFNAMLEMRREDEARLRAVIDTALDAVVQMDADGVITDWSSQAEKIFGWTREEVIGKVLHETVISPQYREAHVQGMRHLVAPGGKVAPGLRVEMMGMHRDGHEFPIELSIAPIKMTGKYELNGFIRDITERKQAEEELRLRAQMLDVANDTIFVLDLDGRFIYLNEVAWKSRGYTRDEMMGMDLHVLDTPEYEKIIGLRFRELMENGRCIFESAHRCKDGSVMPVEINARIIETGGRKLVLSVIRDITERKQSEKKMLSLAYYDTLTTLPNRTLFYDRLAQEIKKAHRASLKMALLFIDLDHFKEINDTLGHNMGDTLLGEAARRISDCVREADTVARWGGDEFTVILSEIDDAASVGRVAENILRKLAAPFQLGGETSYVSASMGITLYPDDATGVEDLLKNADQAMYVAKNAGRNRLSYFTPALEHTAQTRLRLINDLRGALAAGQFRVYYQPIVELGTGRIGKAEALIRWQHPQRGMVSPAQFIPLAEETGLIVEIGDWVFREAAQQVSRWRASHNPALQVSVNVSPVQLCETTYCAGKAWFDYLLAIKLPGQGMVVEITEGLLLNADSGVTGKLLEFRDAGIQVAIDDFGTGYSSLSYLKKFDIDYLKIDQSFVRDLATDPNDMALCEAIVVMAHKLDLKVIAEGVETEAQRKLLVDAGCDYAQGYLFAKPMPPVEFEALLAKVSVKAQ